MAYNAVGNIVSKSDVGSYGYPAPGPGSIKPGAVMQISGTQVGSRSYAYDAAGNLTSALGSRYSNLTYTSFNLPKTLAGSTKTYDWGYGEDHQRVRETRTSGSTSRVTWYFHPDKANGLAFEQEVTNGGTPINRHYVSAMGRTIMVFETSGAIGASTQATVTLSQYWHVDQLGSVSTITDAAGVVKGRYSYDPFGKRREANGTYDGDGSLVHEQNATSTDRGFTGHEHLDDVGIVHMNGRTFDPLLGRFMQADPYIQFADHLQNYNRFSYVLNNPLNATDPTGEFIQFIPAIVAALQTYAEVELTTIFVTAALTSSAVTIAQGGSVSDAILAGAISAGSAMAFNAVGGLYVTSPAMGTTEWVSKAALHAAVGCVSATAGGGRCRDGAIGAGLAELGAPLTKSSTMGDGGAGIARVMIGGMASKLSGGSFSNGATTAAFGYLLNHCAHDGCWVTPAERAHLAVGDYYGYYSECGRGGGDGYCLAALDVAMNDRGLTMARATNVRLENMIADQFPSLSSTDRALKIDTIRVQLAQGHAAALDSMGATAENPKFLTPSQVRDYHISVFQQNGVPASAYGGILWDLMPSVVHRRYDFCHGSCKR